MLFYEKYSFCRLSQLSQHFLKLMLQKLRNEFFRKCSILYGEGNGNPHHYSCLEYPMDGGAWWAAVHGVSKRLTQLSNFTFTFHFHALEKEMATHSSVLAWRIPGMGEPGELPSVGSHRVGHDWNDLAVAAARKKWWEWRKGSFLLSLPYSPEELDFKLIECISGTPLAI